eukprot:10304533-Alexandrium_andersonii.AAC.1
MDYCFLAKDGSSPGHQGPRVHGDPGASGPLQRPFVRRYGGPGSGEHPATRPPPACLAQDGQRARAGRLATG